MTPERQPFINTCEEAITVSSKQSPVTSYFTRILALLFLLAGFSVSPALAQENSQSQGNQQQSQNGDKQEYKRAYNAGRKAAQAKNYEKARSEFMRAAKLADQQGDDQVANNSRKVVAQIDYNYGARAAKNEQYEQALERFNTAIEIYPTFPKSYWGKAAALNKLDRTDEAMATYQEVIALGEEVGNSALSQKARNKIRQHYIYLASQQVGGENPTSSAANRALSYLQDMQEYVEPNANAYYYMAVANNAKGNNEQAVSLANQALEMHRGSRSDKAKIYYAKGKALMEMGNNSAAKTAFQNATYGQYKQSAQHYIERLGA